MVRGSGVVAFISSCGGEGWGRRSGPLFFCSWFLVLGWWDVTGLARRRLLFHGMRRGIGGTVFRCNLVISNSHVLVKLSKKGSSLTLISLLKHHSGVFQPQFRIVIARVIVSGVPCHSSVSCLGDQTSRRNLSFFIRRADFSTSASAHGSPYFLYS